MRREIAIKKLLKAVGDDTLVVSTTGMTSRELFEVRKSSRQERADFLNVGAMGCASAIGLGVALNTDKKVMVLDGDGALLMKLGNTVTIGNYRPKNLVHVVFDNGEYESTGGQKMNKMHHSTVLGSFYGIVGEVDNEEDLDDLDWIFGDDVELPKLLIVKVEAGHRGDLGRPDITLNEIKNNFMKKCQR